MPTTNPRVNVTLSPSLDLLVARLATFERVSKAQVLRELLETAEPALQSVVAMMEAALKARTDSRAELKRGLEQSQGRLEVELAGNLALLQRHASDLVGQAEAVKGRRPARAGGAGALAAGRQPAQGVGRKRNPPSSNRGVKSGSTKPANGGKSPSKGGRR